MTATKISYKKIPLGRFMLAGALTWTTIIGYSLIWNIMQAEQQAQEIARIQARANWDKDQAFRRWATHHGGLYAKTDARTPPNSYLAHLPNRDVITTDGLQLTLMSPAYMMRQMTDEYEEMYGVKGKITGEKLLNPNNKADTWELQALKRFKEGETEITEITKMDDESYLRLMRPMIMKEGCITCHGILGFNVGDIGGGVSVSIPMAPYMAAATKIVWKEVGTHIVIWLLGLIGLFYVVRRGKQYEKERSEHEQTIKSIATAVSTATGDNCFQQLVEHIATIFNTDHAFIAVLNDHDPEKVHTLAVSSRGKIVDNIEYSLKDTPCSKVMNLDTCSFPSNVQQQFPKDTLLHDMAAESYIGKPILDNHGNPIGLLVVLDSKPLKHVGKADELLSIFAARAAGEIERLQNEQALRRSQKMDAIGQLSGGIAHDFNNQLGIILGYLDFLKMYTADNEKATKWVETSTNATLRCTDLTRQLLSFSRTNTHKKSMVNINTELEELDTMFARSVTPAIDIRYSLAEELWLTETDPGEFQDAILNIVINARDAMPNGGKLLIETCNKTLDEEYAAISPSARAGDYVQLILSDTGCGMDITTQEHVFEPFYTTKPKDKGTGLGMSMVYGFVKRFNGFIQIYSEVGIGTTLQIYLPRASSYKVDLTDEVTSNQALPSGTETILIVDDEVNLLHLAEDYLTSLGYKTYLAENAHQALDMLAQHSEIDCLFSDVVMPGGINGYELAQQATKDNPKLKVLLTSGFTSKTITQNETLLFSAFLLSKPYRKADLAQRIRAILDGTSDT